MVAIATLRTRRLVIPAPPLKTLIANGHTAASHGKPKRGRRKKAAEASSTGTDPNA